ncbi:MAG: peptidoglycan DD-metalloendopeptidase family protein [Motiliproteus sp.]|nr:peptidoglycan DD-metalloendopeptidase family protein [Motiliproteus sp.]MCW9054084.1 peptidoglycan DD-metalloendopeptidase family protein [Motiliproteus sp.]
MLNRSRCLETVYRRAAVVARFCSIKLLPLLLVVSLYGCSGGSYAPVSERSLEKNRKPAPQRTVVSSSTSKSHYVVQRGDTLYSIAFRYGKDFRALARANGIGSHYRIYPGQRIRLQEAPLVSSKPNKPVSRPKSVASKTKHEKVNQNRPATVKPTQPKATGKVFWRWPAKGKIIQHYRGQGKLNKGVNISANRGDSVVAAASGEVVYAGSGLLGYGNLIIINHNQQFLSAYAHNHKIFVQESDRVKGGEKIAEAGSSGTTRTMLHFEIRKDGKPVNPLNYLPKR